MSKAGVSKYKQTMIAKFRQEGDTDEQAYERYKEKMRAMGSKGGKNGVGHLYAHGKADPSTAGKKGAQKRWKK